MRPLRATLRELLAATSIPHVTDRWMAERLLAAPWSWPAERPSGTPLPLPERPPVALPGQSLFVTIDKVAGAVLWALGPRRPGLQRFANLGNELRQTLELAQGATLRAMPVLLAPDAVTLSGCAADALAWTYADVKPPQWVDGPSLGGAACLALASLGLGMPVPTQLAACFALDTDARPAPVGGLPEKLRALSDNALAVTTVLVHASQLEAAEETLAALPGALRAVGVTAVAEALAIAFPVAAVASHLREAGPAQRRAWTTALFATTSNPARSLPCYRGVCGAAELLRGCPEGATEESAAKLVVTHAIAKRHEDGQGHLEGDFAWALEAIPAAQRQRLWSHGVQDCTDSSAADPRGLAADAIALLPAGALQEHDLELLGAIGRAYAAAGDWSRAAELLSQAVSGWFELHEEPQAGRPLCEGLRVAGIRGDAVGFEALLAQAQTTLDDRRTDPMSRAFLTVAIGRALTQLGRAGAGLDWLAPSPDDAARGLELPEHLAAARVRWWARALDAVGRSAEADGVRRTLGRDYPGETFQRSLALLDEALRDGGELTPLLDELRCDAALGYDLARIEQRHAAAGSPRGAVGLAERVASETLY